MKTETTIKYVGNDGFPYKTMGEAAQADIKHWANNNLEEDERLTVQALTQLIVNKWDDFYAVCFNKTKEDLDEG